MQQIIYGPRGGCRKLQVSIRRAVVPTNLPPRPVLVTPFYSERLIATVSAYHISYSCHVKPTNSSVHKNTQRLVDLLRMLANYLEELHPFLISQTKYLVYCKSCPNSVEANNSIIGMCTCAKNFPPKLIISSAHRKSW